jgi:hypothetical protein
MNLSAKLRRSHSRAREKGRKVYFRTTPKVDCTAECDGLLREAAVNL